MRSVFEQYNLVTIIDSDTSKYTDNDKWDNLSSSLDFQSRMSIFSNNIDNYIKELHERILKIKITDRNSEALFDFYYTDEELKFLIDSIMNKQTNNFTFEGFFDDCINSLFERTESNSLKTKDYLKEETLHKIIIELDSLFYNNLFEPFDAFKTAIINCKTEIQNKIEEVKAWFSLSVDSAPFKIDIPVHTCHETRCKEVMLNLSISESVQNKNVKGKYLHAFTDIFQILFDNAVRHSKLPPIDLKTDVCIYNDANYTIIEFKNNFCPTINTVNLRKEVTNCLRRHPDPTQIKKSGLARIKILLEKDMQLSDSSIELGNISNNMITFKIKFENSIYSYENIDN